MRTLDGNNDDHKEVKKETTGDKIVDDLQSDLKGMLWQWIKDEKIKILSAVLAILVMTLVGAIVNRISASEDEEQSSRPQESYATVGVFNTVSSAASSAITSLNAVSSKEVSSAASSEIISSNDVSSKAVSSVPSAIVSKAPKVIHVTQIKTSETYIMEWGGDIKAIVATVEPTNASNKKVTWRSSNPNVATVDDKGNIKGIKSGNCDIVVTSESDDDIFTIISVSVAS